MTETANVPPERTGPTGGWALVTNDDGIDAPGLRALVTGALAAGLDVVVAAPAEEASGAGSSLTAERRNGVVPVVPRTLTGLDAVPAYAVGGQPGFIVFAAFNGWFTRPPSLVLAGVNFGANLGTAVLHSGTVGAALTASRLGVSALAVSLDCDHLPPGDRPRWDTASTLLPTVLTVLASAPSGTTVNLNLPNLPVDRLGEPRAATLSTHGRWRAEARVVDGGLRMCGVAWPGPLETGSDVALLTAGHPTLTAVATVGEDRGVALGELLAQLRGRPA